MSAYELYAVDFGSAADKVFGSLGRHSYVAGEFIWTGWDYLGEPTPYDSSRADNRIHFEIEGPGEIIATDNGDPTSFESFQAHDRKAFNGLCLVIIRGWSGEPGSVKLTATAEGLGKAVTVLKSQRGAQ